MHPTVSWKCPASRKLASHKGYSERSPERLRGIAKVETLCAPLPILGGFRVQVTEPSPSPEPPPPPLASPGGEALAPAPEKIAPTEPVESLWDRLRFAGGQLRMGAGFGAAALFGIPTTLIAPPLPLTLLFTRRYQREEKLARWHSMRSWARFCLKRILRTELDVIGIQNLPRPSRGHMYICNHQSIIDILVLMDALDTVAFLAKWQVVVLPILGQCAYAGGSVFVRRGDKQSRQRALDKTLRMCRQSTAVVVFPEGTRSADGELKTRIHPRAIEQAHAEGIRIIPVGLDGTRHIAAKRGSRYRRNQPVAVTIGEPMDPNAWTNIDAWTDAVWRRVRELAGQSRRRITG